MFGVNVVTVTLYRRYLLFWQWKSAIRVHKLVNKPYLETWEHCRPRLAVILLLQHLIITKTCLFKYIENFTTKKNANFQIKNSDVFHISAKNVDCGYSLKPPRRGGSNENPQSMFLSSNKKNNIYPYKRQFYFIKVGFNGVKII